MNKLLKEFISYILEAKKISANKPSADKSRTPKPSNKPKTPQDQAREAGYTAIATTGYWSKSGEPPAEATTRGNKFRVLTPKEREEANKELSGDTSTPSDFGPDIVKVKGPERYRGKKQQPKPLTPADITSSVGDSEPSGIPSSVGTSAVTTQPNVDNLTDAIKTGIVAPGNDFSRYQEAVSVSTARFIIDNPDASDEEIMAHIVSLDCGSATLTSEVSATIPQRFGKAFRQLESSGTFTQNCSEKYSRKQNAARFMTMIVAKTKARRMKAAGERTAKARGGVEITSVDAFSGDQQSLRNLRQTIENGTGKIYTETGAVLSREAALDMIDGFGKSKFPADTALIARDSSGNLILMGFSDKKDLAAIINNSTVSKELDNTLGVIDALRTSGKITEEEHARLTKVVNDQRTLYEAEEEKLKDVTTSPAVELARICVEGTPEQIQELIDKVKTMSKGSNRDKYWVTRVQPFITKAEEAVKRGKKPSESTERQHLRWLRAAGWDGKSPVSEAMALHAFALKSQHILSSDPDQLKAEGFKAREVDLPKDDQEVLFRLGVVDERAMVTEIGRIRDAALKVLTETRDKLNTVTVGNNIGLGTYLDGIQAWQGLHLDMREHEGALSLVAEDVVVDFEAIEDCLGGSGTKAPLDRMGFISQLQIDEETITSPKYGITTGRNREVYSLKGEQRVNVGIKNIRSKEGILGKLQTVWKYHPDFQDCLKSKNK